MSGKTTLNYVAAVEDKLTDCPACGTQIGVLLWQDGRAFTQECPACGAVIKAGRDIETDVATRKWQASELNFTSDAGLDFLLVDSGDSLTVNAYAAGEQLASVNFDGMGLVVERPNGSDYGVMFGETPTASEFASVLRAVTPEIDTRTFEDFGVLPVIRDEDTQEEA